MVLAALSGQNQVMYKIIGADGREYGPVDAAQLRAWVNEGRVDAQTLAQAGGGTEWKPLSAYPEFYSLPKAPPTITTPSGVTAFSLRTNGFAVTGMIMGILSVTLGCCCYGLPFNLLGLIFSLIALSQIKQYPQTHGGKSMAIAGLVLSILSFLLAAGLLLFGAAFNWVTV
jgi:hypothetical protein